MKINYKIAITGGSGRFGSILQKKYKSNKLFYPNRSKLNILSIRSIENYLKNIKPKILIHLAGLSRPMKIHDNNISRSIDLNIIGTANIVKTSTHCRAEDDDVAWNKSSRLFFNPTRYDRMSEVPPAQSKQAESKFALRC